MKKIVTLSILGLLGFVNFSQAQKKDLSTDSIVVIRLNEVTVKTCLKNQTEALKDFFIANKNATTEDILSRLPEINMIKRGSYGTEPLIRSYNTGQSNLLIDGMRIHGACTDKMDPVSIYVEPQNLQSIQVQTSHGTQFGSTLGGTINLKMVSPDIEFNNKLTGNLSSGYQTAANAFFESAVLNYSSNKWAFRGNVTYRNASDYKSSGGTVVPYSAYKKVNYGLSALYLVNEKTTLKTDILLDDGWNIGYPSLPMDVGYAEARIFSISLLKNNPNSKWKNTEYKIYANRIYHAMDDTHRENVAMHMDMPGYSKTWGAFVNSSYSINSKSNLQFRVDFSSTDLSASMTMYQTGQSPMYMLTWPNNRNIQTGIAATYKNRFDSLNTIIISTRIDQFINSLTTEEAKNQLSVLQESTATINKTLKNFSLEFEHRFSKQFSASANLGYGERIPTSTELYGFYLFNAFDNYDYIGSSSLNPETAYKADVKLNYTKPGLQIFLVAYASKINQYILGMYQPTLSTMTIGASGVKQFQNISYAILSGAELGIVYKPAKTVQIVSTFKYNYGADNNKTPLPLIAPLKNITSIRKEIKRWNLLAETEMANPQNRVNFLAKENTTNGYVIANVRLGYSGTIQQNNFSINVGVENIFDKAYKEHLDWSNIKRQGRNFYTVFNFYF